MSGSLGINKAKALYDTFRLIFPDLDSRIRLWGPFDHHSLKIETTDKHVYIFTYDDDKDWSIKTYKNFIRDYRESAHSRSKQPS